MDDVVLSKKESIERCIRQVREYYYAVPSDTPFDKDYFKQDAIAMNLQRACEQCIDLANHTVKTRKLGLPKESKESFRLLAERGIIPRDLGANLEKMVGFRNTLVHQYRQLDIHLMVDVIENHLDELVDFTNFIVKELIHGPAS
ncbi:MAG: DUF86 domain-containing protein [Desulfomonile sp.]|nr:DUF86 domain-containing protein [Desulfomonile sp.]